MKRGEMLCNVTGLKLNATSRHRTCKRNETKQHGARRKNDQTKHAVTELNEVNETKRKGTQRHGTKHREPKRNGAERRMK